MRRLSAPARFEIGLAASLGALLVISWLAYRNLGELIENSRWTGHTFQVMTQLEALLASLRGAESRGRGYVFSGDPEFLPPLRENLGEIEPALERLASLTRDNAAQQRRLERLRPLVRERVESLRAVLAIRAREGSQAAAETLQARLGPRPSLEVQALVDEMLAEERRLAGEREDRLSRKSRSARGVVALGSAFACLMLVSAGLLARRELAQRLAAEEDLRRAKTATEAASVAKSVFLANMSHELRTPLNSIIGFSEILIDRKFGDLNERQARYVGNILGSGRHLLQLINDVLDLSKVESGRMELYPVPCDLATAAGDVLETLQPTAAAKGIAVAAALDDAPPVLADPGRLKQVLYNLLSNAVKFTPEGGSVSLRSAIEGAAAAERDRPAASAFLRTSVSDTGIGIRPEDQERVFREFEQIDSEYARSQAGTGLGLALARRLVELHGGRLWVESEGEGRGSTFHFTLPLAGAAGIYPTSTPARPGARRPGPERRRPLVLVAEDDPGARELLVLWLTEAGYEVAEAADGEEAIRGARELHPDAVTLDLILPRKDGWQVLTELKSRPETRGLPVVIVSMTENRQLGFSLGAIDFLVKPVDRERLLEVVRHAIETRPDGGRTVLLVDDEIPTLEWLTVLLEGEGYRVLKAAGGQEGIDLARRSLPDLIVLDLLMPRVSGFDVVQALRYDGRTREIPILIFTVKEITPEDRQRLNSKVQAIAAKGAAGREELLRELARLGAAPGGGQEEGEA